jgi:hypothetical protein
MSNGWPSTGPEIPSDNEEKDWSEAIEKAATKIVDMGMEMPAVLVLEAHKPVTFFVNQLFIFLAPILAPLFGGRTDELARFFEETENVEKLIRRIEEKAEEKRTEAKLLKQRHKE